MVAQAFYKEYAKKMEQKSVAVFERGDGAGTQFTIRALTQREAEEIWRKVGRNTEKYEVAMLVESVVSPDLKDVELQNGFGVLGAEGLLLKMLLPGEYERLKVAVQEINGGGI